MVDVLGEGYQGAMLVFQMLDQLAYELGYSNGAQDLVEEEPAANVELLGIVQDRLIAQAELRRLQVIGDLKAAEEFIGASYQ